MHGEAIQELVAQHALRRSHFRQVLSPDAALDQRAEREPLLRHARWRRLDDDVVERRGELLWRGVTEDRAREGGASRAGLHDTKARGPVELFPHLRELTRDERPKERMQLWTGQVIAANSDRLPRVIVAFAWL